MHEDICLCKAAENIIFVFWKHVRHALALRKMEWGVDPSKPRIGEYFCQILNIVLTSAVPYASAIPFVSRACRMCASTSEDIKNEEN